MRSEVERYLERRLEIVRQARAHDKANNMRSIAWLATGALEAFRLAGDVTDKEIGDWLDRLYTAAGWALTSHSFMEDGSIRTEHKLEMEFGNGRIVPVDEPTANLESALGMSPGSERPIPQFLQMLVPTEGALGFFGGALRILGVEVYDVSLHINFRLAPLPAPDRLPPYRYTNRPQLASPFRVWGELLMAAVVTDDVGTEYKVGGYSSSGGGNETVSQVRVTPAPPAGASELRVNVHGVRFSVPLGRMGDVPMPE